MSRETFTFHAITKIFGADVSRQAIIKAEVAGRIPTAAREKAGRNAPRAWTLADLPIIGERYGFLKKLPNPTTVAVFTTKGGVLKSTIALNLARLAALHNNKVCVIGLDMQCDITTALGGQIEIEDSEDFETALAKLGSVQGLHDLASGEASLDSIIRQADIPTLSYIPETPELVILERQISSRNMRDMWLRNNVTDPLKSRFDLIILDCSPNWNLLISNALAACDVLISPLECKINNFRNYQAFHAYLQNFKKDIRHDFAHIFVPTKHASTRRLSSDIRKWYFANVPGCISSSIRESVKGEEAMASHLSVPELVPNNAAADEMREVIREIWTSLSLVSKTLPLRASKKTRPRADATRSAEATA